MLTDIHHRLLRAAVLGLVAVMLAMLWGFPGVGKLLAGGVPNWFTEQFGKTILAKAPGLTLSFYSIGAMECLTALVASASLFRGEFLRQRSPLMLYLAILLTLVLFVQLSIGKQLVTDYSGIHDLFMYFAGTVVLLLALRSLDNAIPRA
jgi:hypothetical protein